MAQSPMQKLPCKNTETWAVSLMGKSDRVNHSHLDRAAVVYKLGRPAFGLPQAANGVRQTDRKPHYLHDKTTKEKCEITQQ